MTNALTQNSIKSRIPDDRAVQKSVDFEIPELYEDLSVFHLTPSTANSSLEQILPGLQIIGDSDWTSNIESHNLG